MKLRIDQNSITIRLTPDECNTLEREKSLTQYIRLLTNNSFKYSVVISERSNAIMPVFDGNGMTINIPVEKASVWFSSQMIGIRETISTPAGDEFTVIIEEDLLPKRKLAEK